MKETKDAKIARLEAEVQRLGAETKRLKELLGTPEIVDFASAVIKEAAYQREHWGKAHDEAKSDDEWFWTLGWLAGKAVTDPHKPEDERTSKERKLHRIITTAALACNWHASVLKRE